MSSDQTPKIILKPGRDKSILRRHPWIFSGAIKSTEEPLQPGETAAIYSHQMDFLGFGAFSPSSQIRCRMWSLLRAEDIQLNKSNAYRLIHAESDLIPGLIADVYHDVVVLQFLSRGVERFRDEIADYIAQVTDATFVYERSDAEVRTLEGLSEREGPLWGQGTNAPVIITENRVQFYVDYTGGHKTGFYLDQRENRLKVRKYAGGKEVLDCFSYTGGFSLNALFGGAQKVTAVDISGDALARLQENATQNGYSSDQLEIIQADVFKQLRLFRDQGRQFDLIILDPPKFAPTRKQVQRAARGYKDINLMAMKLLRPNGLLFTFSCSGGVEQDLFQKIIAGAALDAGVDLQFIDKMTQSSDHPVLSSFPEGDYLKGIVCRRV
jgi:23S rRNA (cytosine1962-C5)-methyltransferase